ncbi:MAG: radical SAM protein [Acidimicrobiales bacterium]
MTRIALCGGTYSNPYALAAFVADARSRGAERLFCLGDLGGTGAEPDAIWPLLVDNGIECIAGNYDVAIGRGDTDCGCGYGDRYDNTFAQVMYDFTRAHTSEAFAAWMRGLPTERRLRIEGVEVHLVHGSTLALNDFWWESLPEEAHAERVAASGADLICCTHSGLPWQRRVGGALVVNVGVLGRPANDGRREVWYALVDLAGGKATAELVPLAYDWAAHAASMRAAGLPEAFVDTVESGWWTTCLEVVPPYERSKGRYQLYRTGLPTDFGAESVSWADAAPAVDDGLPVVPLFGSALFPARLWVYSNFHCNLACWYCSVASSPRANRRSIGLERFCALVDEAVSEGFAELYVTGGEPFLEPDIVDMLDYASDRLPTVVLTNATLWRATRLKRLRRLASAAAGGSKRPLVLQTSIDGARAATHDANRGRGSWELAMGGIEVARELGLAVRVGMTETEHNTGEVGELRELLGGLGVTGSDFAVRPLVRRGHSEEGVDVDETNTVPELTVTADGFHWHPAGADAETSPDMCLARGQVPLAEAKRLVIERFLTLRQRDGSLPLVYNCAI